jgi:peroxiredoxin
MRRVLIYGFLASLVMLAAVAYWLSQRELVVERPMLGGPPPTARKHQNLVGRRLPTFAAVDQNGRRVATAALRGQVVVINVWATWCQPCVAELPRIEREIWQRFQSRVTVIAVARGESDDKIREFNRRMKLTFSLVEDPRQKIARQFGGDDMIPRTYVIDRSGVVVHQAIGYGESEFGKLVSVVERAVSQR